MTDDGPLPLDVPRDRDGTFEPRLIGKHERRFTGFDDKVIALYARGLTVREIQAFLADMYAIDVSPDLISTVTDAVVAEVTAWHARPLEPMYPVVFFDALRVKIRDEAVVRSKAVYLALAVLPDGTRDILGIWIEQTEGAKFWMKVFTDLKTRGCQDILILGDEFIAEVSAALDRIGNAPESYPPWPGTNLRSRGLIRCGDACEGSADLRGTLREVSIASCPSAPTLLTALREYWRWMCAIRHRRTTRVRVTSAGSMTAGELPGNTKKTGRSRPRHAGAVVAPLYPEGQS